MNVPGMTALGHCQEERDAPCPTFPSCPCLGLDLFALYPECSTGKAKVNGLWTMLLRMYGPAFTLPLSCRGAGCAKARSRTLCWVAPTACLLPADSQKCKCCFPRPCLEHSTSTATHRHGWGPWLPPEISLQCPHGVPVTKWCKAVQQHAQESLFLRQSHSPSPSFVPPNPRRAPHRRQPQG